MAMHGGVKIVTNKSERARRPTRRVVLQAAVARRE